VDDFDFLKAGVPEFAGYRDEIARHATDRRVRAVLGSALAEMQERLGAGFPQALVPDLEAALLRCEFPDQTFVTRLDEVQAGDALQQRLAALDRRLVELAHRARDVDAAGLSALLHDVADAFDRRTPAAVEAAKNPG